jgi:hypothetical protein
MANVEKPGLENIFSMLIAGIKRKVTRYTNAIAQ